MIFRKDEAVFLGLIGVYIAICYAAALSAGLAGHFYPIMYLRSAIIMSGGVAAIFCLLLALRAYYVMLFVRPPALTHYLWNELKQGPLKAERYRKALPIFIGLIFFLSSFTSMKQIIPGFHAFTWDETFARLDRILHFGVDPWRILQPVLGYPVITWLINIIYNLWLLALFIALYWQMFSLRDQKIRMQFFYTFVLAWAINGTFLAILFSSVGPCFLERLTGSDYYQPLMDYLHHANQSLELFAITTQDSVWESVKNHQSMIGGGISAMPSIHVTTALLFLLTARKLRLGIWPLFAVFFAVILVGSVHLAWHYASDGYLAIITTVIIWSFAGWLVEHVAQPSKN